MVECDCVHWIKGLKRCKLGKANPQTWEDTLKVAELMHPTYICMKSDFRKQLVEHYCGKEK